MSDTRGRVGAALRALEGAHGSFPVGQTTLSVPPSAYDRIDHACSRGVIDLHVHVEDGSRVLLIDEGGEPVVPQSAVASHSGIERAARRLVETQTGITCEVTGITEATILGIGDARDTARPRLFRLCVVVAADYAGGTPKGTTVWRREAPPVAF